MSVLQHSALLWAAETTQTGVVASVDVGGGSVVKPSNESSDSSWDETHQAFGLFGVLRPFALSSSSSSPPAAPAPPQLRPRAVRAGGGARQGAHPGARRGSSERHAAPYAPPSAPAPAPNDEHLQGLFVASGFTVERAHLVLTECGFLCGGEPREDEGDELHLGMRAGLGYGWRYFEFRVGALVSSPGDHAKIAEPWVMPDVQLRLGRRSVGYIDLGLGAYDAPSTIRPGLYVGGLVNVGQRFALWGYLGIHLPVGLCSCTVLMLGGRATLGVDYWLSDRVALGVFGVSQGAGVDGQIYDAGPRLRVAY